MDPNEGVTWEVVRHGLVRTGFTASDETGTVVGELRDPFLRRGERLRWADRDLTLRYNRPRGYVLLDANRRLALRTLKREGRRPLDVVIEDPAVDPGLLLFAAFVMPAHSDDASFPPPPSG